MKGRVVDFKLNDARVFFGKKSKVFGDMAFKGLPNTNGLKMDLALNNSYLNVADMKPYLSSKTIKGMEQMEYFAVTGRFKGTTDSFVTDGKIGTALGNAQADLVLKLKDDNAKSEYEGRLILDDFKIGRLLGEGTTLENVSMDGKLKGVGLTVQDAVLEVDGAFKNIQYKDYTYRNVYLQGKLQKELFEGFASSKDSNLVFDMRGIVDLRNGKENFNISGKLERSNLKKLRLSQQDISLHSNFTVSFSGTNIDNILGFARFHDVRLKVEQRQLNMDTLFVYSEKSGALRDVIVDSDLARVRFEGDFTPSTAISDLQTLAQEYKAYFSNNKYQRNNYYRSKLVDRNKNYFINYSMNLLEAKPLVDFFLPELTLSDYSKLEGSLRVGRTVILNAEGKIDTLKYGDYQFFNSAFDVNTSKFVDSPEVLASGMISSERQKLNILAPTENLIFEGAWDKDHIVFDADISQENSTNKADLNGDIHFTDYGMDLQFERSSFRLLDKNWKINPENTVNITAESVCLKSMTIENEGQILALNGTISTDSLETLRLQTTNFSLASVAPVLNMNIAGTLNADATLNNVFGNIAVDGNISIDSLVYNNIYIGNLAGNNVYDKADKILNINYDIQRDDQKVMSLNGVYLPEGEKESLDLVASLNHTSLSVIEPFTEGIFSKFEGTAQGDIHIGGNLKAPDLEGLITINKGRAQIDYLKAIINFEDKISFSPNKISTDQLRLSDAEGHSGKLRGGATYDDGLRNFRLALNGDLSNFKILNTTAKDNDLFYGTAYASGVLSVSGPLENIFIRANASTNRGTKIYIPLDGATQVSNADYIEFITTVPDSTKDEPVALKTKVKKASSNISMDFIFNITPDAYCELQIDRQTGDVIKAYGNADLNLKVNTLGDFTMTGTYELVRGDYSFNFEAFTKNFKILPKSRIIWSGDPLEGDLDITAEYTQYTSLQPIFPVGIDQASNNNFDLNRKYPVSVLLYLKNRMLSPTVSYSIDFNDYPKSPEFTNSILAFKNRINTNEQEMSRQVGSLLLTNTLMNQGSDLLSFDNFKNNIGQYISNRVGQLASGENFQLGINGLDFSSANQSLINSMQLQFSYNFDDRLRINHSRSGLLGGTSTQNSSNTTGQLIGDWSLEWLVTKDGRLRLKGYNRNSPNAFQNISLNNYLSSYGASLVYTKSFNRFFVPKKPAPKPTEKDLVMQTP